jgi:uncharacterized tellurite resistance protein B-like protein
MSENAASLRQLLEQIFADGIVEPREREALAQTRAQLPAIEVTGVVGNLLKDKWGEASADGRITGAERALLIRIVDELNIVARDLPTEARLALGQDL